MIGFALLVLLAPAATAAAPVPPAVPTPLWAATTGKDDDGDAYVAIARASPPFEIEYRVVAGFAPNLTVRLREGCNGGGWYNQTAVASEGTPAQRLDFVHKAAAATLADAVAECHLDARAADGAMAGFDPAWTALEARIAVPPPGGAR